MTFLNKLTFLKTFLLPGIALIVWPVVLSILFFILPSTWSTTHRIPDLIADILACIFGLLLIGLSWFFILKKKYSYVLALLLGTVFVAAGLFFETFLAFVLLISGGATG